MPLGAALVDRARVIRSEAAAAERVAGSTVMKPVARPWFDALLQLPDGPASESGSYGRRRAVVAPQLLCDSYDEQNEPVEIRLGDRIEVDSGRYGQSMWEVTGEPRPIASLYEIKGYEVGLTKIADHAFQPVGSVSP